ncbi:PREDICTED: pentatricopeptide repeat-containing protein At4g21300-like [Nelumbo nucifera]|uniref:Uncharacterized protein n=2 Tax=Nelumbo nucifera TaxID=4432 RepID=A0A822YK74_NELNU|nr:PREDICTED: pentatricopeptide repeat-containing protein At4g21300-like [Nelumbo nucifera]DAD31375.1 TPA_asm: hypothetical protein HUJ06_010226 [Nelumbo nucifera]
MIVFPSSFRSSTKKTFQGPSIRTRLRFYCISVRKGPICSELPISDRLVSYLESCPDASCLRKLHARIFAYGLGTDILLASKLLNCYASFGCLTESRLVFDRIINRNLSLWNSILVGYFRTGHFEEVLRRYLNLRQQNIGLGGTIITFSLKSCVELGNVELGRGVHVDAFKFRLNADRFVCASLIGLYSIHGDIEDARRVFEEISERDVVVYTAMITGYAQMADRRAYESFRIIAHMRKEGLEPNRVTLVSLLKAAAQLEALEEGRSIHGYAVRRGFDSNGILETSLMDMYIKCGARDMIASLFRRISMRNVSSWNALIASHIQKGQPVEALNLLHLMLRENLIPDLTTLANGLLGCADLKYLAQGKSIHGYIIRAGVHLDIVATTALIDMYSKCNRINQARKLFDKARIRDVILFNVIIAGYLRDGSPSEAIGTFRAMVEAGIRPNLATILNILSASADLTDTRKGRCLHAYIVRQGLEVNIEIANKLLHMYAKCGRIDIARQVFNRMTYRDLVTWTSMMMSCVAIRHADEVLTLLRTMQQEKVHPDSITLITLLQAFSQLGRLKLAQEVHGYMYKTHLERDLPIINSLVTTYAKCGRLDIAKYLFENTSRCDLTSWNTMIAAYGMHGNSAKALQLFDQMQKEKIVPDEITFTLLLSACSHAGLVEEGKQAFHSMTARYLMVPCEEHYNCMVDLLGRAGHLVEAYDLVKYLPSGQSASALKSLLSACRVYKNFEMGEAIGRQLLDLEPENPGAYTLVSNIFAEAGKWDEVARIRAIANEKGLKKITGYSVLE